MTSSAPELDVIVPAFNEAQRLPSTLAALRAALAGLGSRTMVTIVDNGSTDGTSQVALSAPDGDVPVRLLRWPIRGKGHAVRAGMIASPARYVGFCDADLATSLDCLPQVLRELRQGTDVIVGSRAHVDSFVQARHSIARKWGAAVFRHSVRRVVQSVGDTQCGFKFFEGELARDLFGETVCGGFAFDVEVLARAERRGARITELPVSWIDVAGSTFSPVQDGWRSFADVASIRRRLKRELQEAAAAHAQSWQDHPSHPLLATRTPAPAAEAEGG